MSDTFLSTLARKAELREAAGLRRTLRHREFDEPVFDLAGNDYLGLARNADVAEAAARALRQYGLGATGSRLVRGSTVEHEKLERELAHLLNFDQALVYSSGYMANLGAIRALARPDTVFVLDAHAHASLIDGCRLAGVRTITARHNDLDDFAHILAEKGRDAVVVTESVFSVDGDLAPLRELNALCSRFSAALLVDDAHALGVIGAGGAVRECGLAGEPNIVVTATLSKAFGAAGGVVVAHQTFIRHLVDTSRTFLYDTALSPAIAAGALAALRIIAEEGDGLRVELHRRAAYAHQFLTNAGLEVTTPAAGVLSVAAPSADAALSWARACAQAGVAVGCFRPPSTPDRRSRLRMTINVGLNEEDFRKALSIICESRPR